MKRQKILYLILIIFTVFLLINNLINIKLIGEKIEEIKRIEERLKQLEQEIQQQKRNIERILQGKLEVVATAYTSNLQKDFCSLGQRWSNQGEPDGYLVPHL